MRSIAVINQKGGSGKTTTVVNLAAALAEKKRKILVIDLDSQGSTTNWFHAHREDDKGIYCTFVEQSRLINLIRQTDYKTIDIIISSNWLVGLEKMLAQEVGAETILKYQLELLDQHMYDYVLIDCPPTLGILTVNALSAVDEIIVPVEARFMALSGLVQLLQTVDLIKQRLNPNLKIAGILPCRVDARTNHSQEVVTELQENFKALLYKTAIRENIKLSEASSFAKPITIYDNASNGALDYRAFAKEVIKQEVR